MARFFGMPTIGVVIALYVLSGENVSQRVMRTHAFIMSPFQQAQTAAPTAAPVVIAEDTPSSVPVTPGTSCAASRYTVRLHNVNDVASLVINQTLVARARWGYHGTQPFGVWRRIGLRPGDSGWLDLTPYVKPGKNLLNFQLWEKYGLGRSSVSIVLKRDDAVVFTEVVDTRSGRQGMVYEKTVAVVLPECVAATGQQGG